MALTFINIQGVVAAGATSYIKMMRDRVGAGVQVSPTAGGTATVHYTLTDPGLWGSDGSGAAWEPVGTTYQFTALETIHFRDRISGVRVASASEATTVDVIGGRP